MKDIKELEGELQFYKIMFYIVAIGNILIAILK